MFIDGYLFIRMACQIEAQDESSQAVVSGFRIILDERVSIEEYVCDSNMIILRNG